MSIHVLMAKLFADRFVKEPPIPIFPLLEDGEFHSTLIDGNMPFTREDFYSVCAKIQQTWGHNAFTNM
jgi:hypothetical protein